MTYPVYSPSTGEVLAQVRRCPYEAIVAGCHVIWSLQVPDMTPEDAQEAVQSAYQAQKSWAAATAKVSE